MKNYSEPGRACGSTTMILCSLGQTPGVNYSLLIAIFFKKLEIFHSLAQCVTRFACSSQTNLYVIEEQQLPFPFINASFIIVLISQGD